MGRDQHTEISKKLSWLLRHGVFQSQNGVVLARCVPPPAIVGIRALSARAKRDEATLRALIGAAA